MKTGCESASGGRRTVRRARVAALTVCGVAAIAVIPAVAMSGGERGQTQIPTTVEDFFQPGTQPEPDPAEFAPIAPANQCSICHGSYLNDSYDEPFDGWVNSMMGQASRDPMWQAAVTIANQDANVAGEYCIRCHAPAAWLGGRSTSGTTDQFTGADWEGVSCHFCHRTVDPTFGPDSPPEDESIINDLMFPPQHPGNARYVVDPSDVRRGPFDIPEDMNAHGVPIIESPFHRSSDQCATCHDVSNPVYSWDKKQGKFVLNSLDMGHPTQDPQDMMPEQRTYSEWANSQFAKGGVVFDDGRFGGNLPDATPIQSCQDCHMPDRFNGGCVFWESPPFFPREDLPFHGFNGANTWVLGAVYEKYNQQGNPVPGLTQQSVDDARARTVDMLRAASDMQTLQLGDELKVRVINWSGHKLPTGYPEGRRMWLNVKFYDDTDMLIGERGAYDFNTANLDDTNTRVYEVKFGMDQDVANQTGLPPGPSFHLVLNNYIAKDNRIPPVGFTNAAFEDVRAQPVAYTYDDGQHWDDTTFEIPSNAASAVVTLYFQTTSREYAEFLRDANTTDMKGQELYDLWVSQGKSAPVDMDMVAYDLTGPSPGDVNDDGVVNVFDLLELLNGWGPCEGPDLCPSDVNDDGATDVFDLLAVLGEWGL